MARGDDLTPIDPFPALRAGEEKQPVDLGHLLTLQRWLQRENQLTRREHGEAMTEVRQRLTGIESQLGDGRHQLAKHESQLAELVDQSVELERRVDVIEAWKYAELGERVKALEAADLARANRETAEAARREAVAKAEKAQKGSLAVRIRDTVLITAASTAAGGLITGIIGLGWYLISQYAKASP